MTGAQRLNGGEADKVCLCSSARNTMLYNQHRELGYVKAALLAQ